MSLKHGVLGVLLAGSLALGAPAQAADDIDRFLRELGLIALPRCPGSTGAR
jgi:hypothetical protein